MNPIRILLPYERPPLMSNKRLHHMAEHRIKRDIRQAGFIAGRKLLELPPEGWVFPITEPVDVCLTWHVPTKHRRDADGPQNTLKSYQDGLVDAGVIYGDHYTIVRRSYCQIVHAPGQPMRLTVEISAA